MDETLSSPEQDSEVSKELMIRPETQASKRRKVAHQKTVVTVKIGPNVGKLKNEGPPSDFWSWRKYGQKPIKGSPYPRGYYRCSTSKGCSAKKQVERSKTDASVLIITYTSSHNHPGPDVTSTTKNQSPPPKEAQMQPNSEDDDHDHTAEVPKEDEPEPEPEPDQDEEQEQERKVDEQQEQDHFHYIQSPIRSSQDIVIYQEEDPFSSGNHLEKTLLDEHPHPLCYSQLLSFSSTPKSEEEEDFYDELEELLPTSSYFPSFMRSNLSQLERIPFVPS
ncbi:putative transcription factor WRKY family [Rosa chinensis]|uniref:Putative transcription factor WRKY family n=1 Tax=Rosa chinensis TaxID=74649 RepID=A0A2P6PI52_ROSCH|nr:probable WRKY transcription factor 65 [Rosa chinensis]PRQ21602.1 putative transcription factor WRKY family [Rosa chinensis]